MLGNSTEIFFRKKKFPIYCIFTCQLHIISWVPFDLREKKTPRRYIIIFIFVVSETAEHYSPICLKSNKNRLVSFGASSFIVNHGVSLVTICTTFSMMHYTIHIENEPKCAVLSLADLLRPNLKKS